MATAAPHGVAPVAGAASLSPPQRRTAATDKAAFRLPPPAFPVNASTLSTSASANAAASLAAEFREWLSVAYLGSLLVNGADEDVARRIGTAMAVLSARPAPAAIHNRMLLDEGQRVILVDATDDEIVACLELQDVQRIDTYLSSSAVGTLGLLENTPAGTVLHAVRLHTTDQTLQAAHCLQQAMDEMHWEQRLRLRTKEGSSKRHSRSSSGSASPSTPIGIASTTVAGVKPLPVPRPKSPPRYPGLGAAADDGPRPRPSLYPPPSPSVFNPVFVDATPPRPCAVYTKTVDVVAVTQPPLDPPPNETATPTPAELALYRSLTQLQFVVMCDVLPMQIASIRVFLQACSNIVDAAPTQAIDAIDLPARRHTLLATIDCLSQADNDSHAKLALIQDFARQAKALAEECQRLLQRGEHAELVSDDASPPSPRTPIAASVAEGPAAVPASLEPVPTSSSVDLPLSLNLLPILCAEAAKRASRRLLAKDSEALERIVKKNVGSCFRQLMQHRTEHPNANGMLEAFFMTYRLTASPSDLLAGLGAYMAGHADHLPGALEMTRLWVLWCWPDIAAMAGMVESLRIHLSVLADRILPNDLLSEVQCTVTQLLGTTSFNVPCAANAPKPKGPTPGILVQMDAGVVAEQLTMLNTELFLRVHPIEYVNYVFQVVGMGHSHAHSGTRNLDTVVRRFQEEQVWAEAEMLQPTSAKARMALVSKFIAVAKRCLELGNFFSFFSIMAALDNPQLASLRRQPKALPDKVRRELAVLEAATDPSRNMKTYREQYVARALQPRLPFLPLHLKDLYFLRESLSTPPTMHQAQVLTRLVLDVLVWQPFRLRPDFGMQGYFRVSVPAATTASVKPKTADPVSSAPLSPTAAPPTQSVAVAAAAAAAAAPPARQPPPSPNDAMRSFALSNLTSPSVKRLVKSRRGSSGESSANTSAPTARRRPSSGTAAELQSLLLRRSRAVGTSREPALPPLQESELSRIGVFSPPKRSPQRSVRSSASSPRLLPKDPTGRRRLHALNLAGSPATPPVVCTPPQEQHLQNEVTVAGGGQKVLQLERPLPLHVGNENNDGDDWVVTEDEHDLSFSSLVASDVLPITPPMAAQIVPVTSPSGGRSPFNMLVNDRTQETFI